MSGIHSLLFQPLFFSSSYVIILLLECSCSSKLINYYIVLLCDRLKILSSNLTVIKWPIVWFLKIGISMLRWLN